MSNIKKGLALTSTAVTYLWLAASVYAQVTPSPIITPPVGAVAVTELKPVLNLVVNLFFAAAGFSAIVYLAYGGIKWITSRGDKVGVEAARKQIVAAIIGLVVVLGTFTILNVVFGILGVKNPLNDIPHL